MTYTYNNKGTCSVRTVVELNDDHTLTLDNWDIERI